MLLLSLFNRLVPVPVVGFAELQQRMKQQEQETLQHAKRLEVGHPSRIPYGSLSQAYNKEINKIAAVLLLSGPKQQPLNPQAPPFSIFTRPLQVILAIT